MNLWWILLSFVFFILGYLWLRKPIFVDQEGITHIRGRIPWIGCGIHFVKNPKLFTEQNLNKYGDVFVMWMWGSKFYFVFSPEGMKALYQVEESIASFPRATKNLLSLKVPSEITDLYEVIEPVWNQIFAQAFNRKLMLRYLTNAKDTILGIIDELPNSGKFDISKFMRQFVHRFSFQCWCGKSDTERYLNRFKNNFDLIDPELAFVNPILLLRTILTGKKKERKAIQEIVSVMNEIQSDRKSRQVYEEDLFTNLSEVLPRLLPSLSPPEVQRVTTYFVISMHMASQTNLSSAFSWLFVNLLLEKEHLDKVLSENMILKQNHNHEDWITTPEVLTQMTYLDKCIYETIRLAQQSITLRLVRKPMTITQGTKSVTIPPGSYLTTLLNVMNCKAPPVPDNMYPPQQFHPERYTKDKLADCPAAQEFMISTFGHSKHACPGRLFSMNTFKIVIPLLFERLELTPQFKEVKVPHTQMGAVARLDRSCWVEFKKKTTFQ